MIARFLAVILASWFCMSAAAAHEVRPAYLSIEETGQDTWTVVWKQPVLEGKRLRIEPVFRSADSVCPLTLDTRENLQSSTVERGTMSCAVDGITLAGLEHTLTDVIVEIRALGEKPATILVQPSDPVIDLTEPTRSPANAYFMLGVEHIVFGWDHLLFVIGLILLIESRHRLIGVITAFTLAHSLTLGLAALGVIGIPSRPVEILIAASIILLGIEILAKQRGQASITVRYPYLIAVVIGLVHGLGFAGALSDIGLPDGTELLALFMFNIGVEAGQVTVILAVLLVLGIAARIRPAIAGKAELVAAYALGTIGMFWVFERLAQYLV